MVSKRTKPKSVILAKKEEKEMNWIVSTSYSLKAKYSYK
jgi:hypothetical protein